MKSLRRLSYSVGADMDGRSVEYVLRHGLHMGAHAVRHAKFIEDGIMLDGLRVHATVPVRVGQTVSIVIGDTAQAIAASQVLAVPGALNIVFEDEDLLIIDKPAGLVMHPGTGHRTDTLGNRVMAYYEQNGIDAGFHPVHRLDAGTSGLVVIAKNAHAQDRLQQSLHSSDFQRVYLAICVAVPVPPVGIVDAPIGFDAQDAGKRCVSANGKTACTHYSLLQSENGQTALVELRLQTGRTHQIRIHMAHIGCPLLGDSLYGTADPALARPALHSARLSLIHPVYGNKLTFDSPLPPDMSAILNSF